jgi:prevent-host-death family protein
MVHGMVHFSRKLEGDMQFTVSEAKAKLTELVKRAEDGEEIILTRHGHEIVRLVALKRTNSVQDRQSIVARVRASAAQKRRDGATAARSQDFLYDDKGLPS